jgi:hypothetical protein
MAWRKIREFRNVLRSPAKLKVPQKEVLKRRSG